ncbi:MAG: ATP-binding protein, partial [Chloroflexota bacterium]|nr:ATP-binding protein [Chloroflexota bacterium]
VGAFDGPRLQRVLTNLLSNALKYSPDGKEVWITVTRELACQGRPDGEVAVLTVRDQGVGIPAPEVPRIFEPFYRAQNVAHRISGIGLGLAGSRQIVEQHGGTIQVESREGHGSTFTVRLPLHPTGGAAAGANGILHAARAAETAAAAPGSAERAAERPPPDAALRL